MNRDPDFLHPLRKTLAALLLCAALVLICYWLVDRPVAYYVRDQGFAVRIEPGLAGMVRVIAALKPSR